MLARSQIGLLSGLWGRRLLPVFVAISVVPGLTHAQVLTRDSLAASTQGTLSSWIEHTRFTLDVSHRASSETDADGWRGKTMVGVDLQHVFSSSRGDIGTLVFQGFFTGTHEPGAFPVALDPGPDWDFAFRSVWFNFTGLGRKLPSVKIGHFEVPFGLEHTIDSNGWVRQTIKPRNVGFVGDWGVSLNGVVPGFEYEASLTRGTGKDWANDGGPFLVGARLATPRWRGNWVGVSIIHGRVWSPAGAAHWAAGLADATASDKAGPIVERARVGLESGLRWHRFEALGELSLGSDSGQRTLNGLLELDWETYTQRALIYVQWRHYGQRYARSWVSDDTLVLGTRLWPSPSFAVSAAASLGLTRFTGGADGARLVLQLRYRT